MCNRSLRSRISILVLSLMIMSASLLPALPASAGTSVSVTVTTNDPNTMAGLLIGGIMAAVFSNATNNASAPTPAPGPIPVPAGPPVVVAPPRPADPWTDLPCWYVASYADVPVEHIIELRRSGRHWGDIVEYYHLPMEFRGRQIVVIENPGKGKGRGKAKGRPVFEAYRDDEFERFVFVRFLEEYYAVPRTTIVVWLDRGVPLQDIFLSVNLAARVRIQPDVVLRSRQSGESWEIIARRYRVNMAELGRPVARERFTRRHVRFEGDQGEGQHGEEND